MEIGDFYIDPFDNVYKVHKIFIHDHTGDMVQLEPIMMREESRRKLSPNGINCHLGVYWGDIRKESDYFKKL